MIKKSCTCCTAHESKTECISKQKSEGMSANLYQDWSWRRQESWKPSQAHSRFKMHFLDEQFEVDSVNGVQLQKIFLKTTFGCIETLNLPLLVTSNLLTIVIQACRSTSSPTSRPKLFPGVWLLSGCSQDQSFCSSPFRYLHLWELHRIRLRSRLFLPQIFKIQRAYVY